MHTNIVRRRDMYAKRKTHSNNRIEEAADEKSVGSSCSESEILIIISKSKQRRFEQTFV